MGFLDAVLGKRKIQGPAPDRLFALTTAYVDLETAQNVKTTGKAGIVFQQLATADFQQIVSDTEELLKGTGEETASKISTKDDEFGYRWVIVEDPELEDLVVAVNTTADNIAVGGYADRILAAVFSFKDQAGNPIYLIYNYKRGAWYPFVPAPGDHQGNTEREVHAK